MNRSQLSSRFNSLMSLVVAIVFLSASAAMRVNAKDGGLVGVEGVLTAVDPTAGTLTIRTRRMQDVAISVNATTKIERNDRRATLAAFVPGDRVEAKLLSATGNLAIKVEAVGP
jgi:hypothetical protein